MYGYVAPSQWQNFCKARGRNSKEIKEQVLSVELTGKKESKILSIQFVKDQFGIETTNDNVADSICMGFYATNIIEISNPSKGKKKK